MNLRRVAPIDWLVGLCGAGLIASLWLPWYRIGWAAAFDSDPGRPDIYRWRHVNAWQAMSVNDVIFLIAGCLAIALVVVTAMHSSSAVPIAAATFTAIGGTLAAVLALVRLVWPPDLVGIGSAHRSAGVWIGAGLAIALAVSAWADMRDERRGVEGSTRVDITVLPPPKGSGA